MHVQNLKLWTSGEQERSQQGQSFDFSIHARVCDRWILAGVETSMPRTVSTVASGPFSLLISFRAHSAVSLVASFLHAIGECAQLEKLFLTAVRSSTDGLLQELANDCPGTLTVGYALCQAVYYICESPFLSPAVWHRYPSVIYQPLGYPR